MGLSVRTYPAVPSPPPALRVQAPSSVVAERPGPHYALMFFQGGAERFDLSVPSQRCAVCQASCQQGLKPSGLKATVITHVPMRQRPAPARPVFASQSGHVCSMLPLQSVCPSGLIMASDVARDASTPRGTAGPVP